MSIDILEAERNRECYEPAVPQACMINKQVNMPVSIAPNAQKTGNPVIDSAGWTHVRRGARRQKDGTLVSRDLTNLPPTQISDGLTLDKVEKKMQKYKKIWGSSECCSRVNRILECIILREPTMSITQCVVLGLGSFTGGSSTEASMWELVALRTILETLGKDTFHQHC